MFSAVENQSIPFAHSVIRTDGRILILSTCPRCEKGRLVSLCDGSLKEWETTHHCLERSPTPATSLQQACTP
jgi:hypothetical protein